MMRLAEIREEDASPEIRAIYADMRGTMRLPLVNLIYRHLATSPGVLPHTWAFVRAMVVSGDLDAARTRLEHSLNVPALEPFTADDLCDADKSAIRHLLDAYNRGNGFNVIALRAVRTDLHRRAHPPLQMPAVAGDGAPSIPRLLRFAELSPGLAATVSTISALHEGMNGVIPSLYLHLANWPGFLDASCRRIAPALKDGSFGRARRTAIAQAGVEANALIAPMQGVAMASGFPDAVLAVLDQFIDYVIPEMLPIGIALDRALR